MWVTSMPVVVIRLELKLGKISFMLSSFTKPQVLLLILFKLLQVISAYANALRAYRQLQQGMSNSQPQLTMHVGVTHMQAGRNTYINNQA